MDNQTDRLSEHPVFLFLCALCHREALASRSVCDVYCGSGDRFSQLLWGIYASADISEAAEVEQSFHGCVRISNSTAKRKRLPEKLYMKENISRIA